jgi:serine/threonine protein kinase/energy-converting hydrogenase Eha subunit A
MDTTDRYTRHRRIATGGMGEVWLAHDEVLDRDVAVKYLKREYADDEGLHARVLVVARSAASVQHPAIATVFDFGESSLEDGVPFLVMEYVDGRTLSDLLAGGRTLDPERARDIVAQAARGLAEAHASGLVHRDVKPGNIMVTADGLVKITDFGIARAADGMSLTETGQLVGTPSYLSPEQAGGQAATPASDVYALGVVLFECLAGRRPFEADSPVATALAHIREPIPELPPEVPEDLAAVTTRALAKHPEDRYPDAGALASALAATGPEPTMMLTAPVVEPVAGVLRESLDAGTRFPRPRWPLLLTGLSALVIVVALVISSLQGHETDNTPGPGATPSVPRVSSTDATTVRVDPTAYVGKKVAVVRSALSALGLKSRVVTVDNPGGHAADTVSALTPTGAVAVGTTVTLAVWGPPNTPKPHKGKGKGKGH